MRAISYFNPRSRAGSDVQNSASLRIHELFQSTLPRGERLDLSDFRRPPLLLISIHAPARGATPDCFTKWQDLQISIHAPARGATRLTRARSYRLSDFNPRSRAGSDAHREQRIRRTSVISIHAPARGATGSCAATPRHAQIFQSTLPRGERPGTAGRSARLRYISIHAPARGATLVYGHFRCSQNRFQSTLPRGERRIC